MHLSQGTKELKLERKVILQWCALIETVRSHDDFSDTDVDSFQDKCDNFYHNWMLLHQRKGVTNYFHMVGAGHLSYYMKHWKNLFRYCQQGWKALNHVIKTFYFY